MEDCLKTRDGFAIKFAEPNSPEGNVRAMAGEVVIVGRGCFGHTSTGGEGIAFNGGKLDCYEGHGLAFYGSEVVSGGEYIHRREDIVFRLNDNDDWSDAGEFCPDTLLAAVADACHCDRHVKYYVQDHPRGWDVNYTDRFGRINFRSAAAARHWADILLRFFGVEYSRGSGRADVIAGSDATLLVRDHDTIYKGIGGFVTKIWARWLTEGLSSVDVSVETVSTLIEKLKVERALAVKALKYTKYEWEKMWGKGGYDLVSRIDGPWQVVESMYYRLASRKGWERAIDEAKKEFSEVPL